MSVDDAIDFFTISEVNPSRGKKHRFTHIAKKKLSFDKWIGKMSLEIDLD